MSFGLTNKRSKRWSAPIAFIAATIILVPILGTGQSNRKNQPPPPPPPARQTTARAPSAPIQRQPARSPAVPTYGRTTTPARNPAVPPTAPAIPRHPVFVPNPTPHPSNPVVNGTNNQVIHGTNSQVIHGANNQGIHGTNPAFAVKTLPLRSGGIATVKANGQISSINRNGTRIDYGSRGARTISSVQNGTRVVKQECTRAMCSVRMFQATDTSMFKERMWLIMLHVRLPIELTTSMELHSMDMRRAFTTVQYSTVGHTGRGLRR